MMVKRAALVVSLALALLLTACGSPSTPSARGPTSITIGVSPPFAPVTWWAPVVPATACYSISGGLFGPDTYRVLLWTGKNDTIDYARSIASRISVRNHDTEYVIHLKPEWHWSNGKPITSADVVYDAKLILAASEPSSPLPYCSAGLGGVPADWKSVAADGAHTVIVTTTHPVNPTWFIYTGLAQLIPIPKQVWDRYSNMTKELAWIKQVGSEPGNPVYRVIDGPYRLVQWTNNVDWIFEANPRFSGTHKPTIQRIVYDFEASPASMFLGLRKGTLQIGQMMTAMDYYKPALALKNYRVVGEPVCLFSYLMLNFRPNAYHGESSFLNHLYIRQALQYGIDQRGILRTTMHGLGVVDNGPVPPIPPNVFYDKSMPQYYPFNIAKGRSLLEAHGWRLVNGVMEKNGRKLELTILYGAGQGLDNAMQIIQADWRKMGVETALQAEDEGTVYSITSTPSQSPKWAITPGSAGNGAYPSGDADFLLNGGSNWGAYSNPTMTRLIQRSDAACSPRQCTTRFYAYEKFAAQNLPLLWMPNQDWLYVVAKNVHGFQANYSPYNLYTPDNLLSVSP